MGNKQAIALCKKCKKCKNTSNFELLNKCDKCGGYIHLCHRCNPMVYCKCSICNICNKKQYFNDEYRFSPTFCQCKNNYYRILEKRKQVNRSRNDSFKKRWRNLKYKVYYLFLNPGGVLNYIEIKIKKIGINDGTIGIVESGLRHQLMHGKIDNTIGLRGDYFFFKDANIVVYPKMQYSYSGPNQSFEEGDIIFLKLSRDKRSIIIKHKKKKNIIDYLFEVNQKRKNIKNQNRNLTICSNHKFNSRRSSYFEYNDFSFYICFPEAILEIIDGWKPCSFDNIIKKEDFLIILIRNKYCDLTIKTF